jgi:hypothetical protein
MKFVPEDSPRGKSVARPFLIQSIPKASVIDDVEGGTVDTVAGLGRPSTECTG